MIHKHLGAALLTLATVGLVQPAQAAFDLRIDPTSDSIEVGETSSADIYLDATGTGAEFLGFGVDLLYDGAILSVNSAAVNAIVFDGLATADTATAGVIKFDGLSAPPPASLSGTEILLASVSFSGLADGVSALTFAFPDFNAGAFIDGIFRPIPPGGAVLPDSQQTGAITVSSPTPAPLPSTLALFAFAGLFGLRRFL